jgi:tRNA A-37 threonylcarbamoyl transferase component Bud32
MGERPVVPPSHTSSGDARRGWLAVERSAADALTRVGFGPDSDGDVRAAAETGRAALHELLLEIDGRRLRALVRHHRRGGWPARLNIEGFGDPDRPFAELRVAERLRALGLATPRVFAARARRLASGRFELALVTERIEGAVDVAAGLAQRRGSARHALVRATARFVRALFDVGLVHADLHPKNLLVDGDEHTPRVWVVDLDRAHFARSAPLDDARRRAQLARLLRWCLRRAETIAYTRTDGRRFLRAFGVVDERAECRLLTRRAERRIAWT